jgi:hypothetical protein
MEGKEPASLGTQERRKLDGRRIRFEADGAHWDSDRNIDIK